MLNDKRIKACILTQDTTTELLVACSSMAPVSHSMGARIQALCLTEDNNSSSSDEDETYEASIATTSESSESPATPRSMTLDDLDLL